MQGVVLQTYGAGNMPTNREDLLAVLAAATKSGIIIVNITQCSTGSVSGLYETGKVVDDSIHMTLRWISKAGSRHVQLVQTHLRPLKMGIKP